jgi:hypothetical protein
MTSLFTRRHLLQAGAAAAVLPLPSFAQQRRFAPQVGAWRNFEVTTTVNVADPQGLTRLWLPLPDIDTDWQPTPSRACVCSTPSSRPM